MGRTVVALYDNFEDANNAVRELIDRGFRRENISFMANDQHGEYGQALNETNVNTFQAEEANTGAGVGAGIGAAVGGLAGVLIGLGALAIPGVGPVLAAGPLATVLAGLAGAGAGAVAGGVIGALVDMGIPEESAGYYAEGVRRGGTLVTVQAEDNMTDKAVDILNRHNPVDLNERVSTWRESGWTGYQGSEPAATTGEDVIPGWAKDYDRYDNNFRNHFNSSPYSANYTYADYQPAYRYGYDLARNPSYQGRTWNDLEPEARRNWEADHEGAWDQFKDEIKYAWNDITGKGHTHTQDYGTMDRGTDNIGTFDAGDTTTTGDTGYMRYDAGFQQHFATSPYARNYSYTDYQPAYRYGYDLAHSPLYSGSDWSSIEPQAQRDWESQGHEGTWSQVKDAVRHAWRVTKEAVS